MHGRKSCWEVIEESLLKYHKAKGKQAYYPLFLYVLGHFKFFHQDDNIEIEKYRHKFYAWKDHK